MNERTVTKASATKRVLIIDDEPIVLTVLRDFFASFRHGHAFEITTAESAAGAFEILRREPFDLILLDVVIPRPSVAGSQRRTSASAY
jgi:YesN/AraC family two-component response regulator